MDPPEPASPPGRPYAPCRAARAAGASLVRSIVSCAPGHVRLEVADQRVELGHRVGAGDDAIDSLARTSGMSTFEDRDGRHVEAADGGHRGLCPRRIGDRHVTDHLHALEQVRSFRQLGRSHVDRPRHAVAKAGGLAFGLGA